MQVREVLDLRYRQQPGEPGSERKAQDGLLVQQRVEDPAGPERAEQAPGHAVDAPLAGHVLAEDEHLRAGRQLVGEGPVDRLGQRERALILG